MCDQQTGERPVWRLCRAVSTFPELPAPGQRRVTAGEKGGTVLICIMCIMLFVRVFHLLAFEVFEVYRDFEVYFEVNMGRRYIMRLEALFLFPPHL